MGKCNWNNKRKQVEVVWGGIGMGWDVMGWNGGKMEGGYFRDLFVEFISNERPHIVARNDLDEPHRLYLLVALRPETLVHRPRLRGVLIPELRADGRCVQVLRHALRELLTLLLCEPAVLPDLRRVAVLLHGDLVVVAVRLETLARQLQVVLRLVQEVVVDLLKRPHVVAAVHPEAAGASLCVTALVQVVRQVRELALPLAALCLVVAVARQVQHAQLRLLVADKVVVAKGAAARRTGVAAVALPAGEAALAELVAAAFDVDAPRLGDDAAAERADAVLEDGHEELRVAAPALAWGRRAVDGIGSTHSRREGSSFSLLVCCVACCVLQQFSWTMKY
eukprot:Rhum_TRINITY_DN12568_c0_g2::Rhum_TRINITY_DN12568_c0_g2_i1::g.52900::m.52900